MPGLINSKIKCKPICIFLELYLSRRGINIGLLRICALWFICQGWIQDFERKGLIMCK